MATDLSSPVGRVRWCEERLNRLAEFEITNVQLAHGSSILRSI
jgi:hypothetical protein